MKVAAIGDNCIDLYEKLNKYYATGNAVDFAVNMKKLGIDTAVISTTGDDEYGKLMLRELEKQHIDLSHFRVAHGKTAVSYMDLDGLERIYLDFAASCDLVHSAFWGNAHMHLKEIHEKGARICFDFATEFEDPMVEEIAPYVDYPFFSFESRTEETDAFLKKMVARGASIAVGTFGEEGSVAYDGKQFYEYGIVKADVVNTIGAGDSYMAGFMNGVLKGWDIPRCQRQGAQVAAQVVGVFGPWTD